MMKLESFFDREYQSDQFMIKYLLHNETRPAKIVLVDLPNGETFFIYMDHDEVWHDKNAHLVTSFKKLRTYLYEKEKILLCKGCRADVNNNRPSSLEAFVLVLGKRIDPDNDAVHIFDEELDISKIGTVLEQKKFYEEWLESIKGVAY